MTTKDEALRLALGALEYFELNELHWDAADKAAIAACREALEQKDEQEPVAEITADDMGRPFNAIRIGAHFYKEIPPVGTKLYTAPPKRQPLTDDELNVCAGGFQVMPGTWCYAFARAIEAKIFGEQK